MADICSSHLRLVSMLSSWYSPALLNRDLSAAKSCSARVQRAPVAAWQKITSRLSCREVSDDEEKQRAVKLLNVEATRGPAKCGKTAFLSVLFII